MPHFPKRPIAAGPVSAVCLCWLVLGCGSAPRSDGTSTDAPAWTRQAARTVDGGYIVYVGSGRDRSAAGAELLAEGQALTDLAAECSFAPKGARIEDRYENPTGILYTAYVKVGVDFDRCEEAKAQIQPEDIRKLASVAMTQEIRRYQDAVNEQLHEEENGEDEGTDLSPQTQEALAQTGPPAYSTFEGPGVPVAVMPAVPMFWYWREQVAYEKQVVILAPPAVYAPGTVASRQFTSRITAPSRQIRAFELTHPDLRTSPATYSAFHQGTGINRMSMRGRNGFGIRRFPSGMGRGARPVRRYRGRVGRRWR